MKVICSCRFSTLIRGAVNVPKVKFDILFTDKYEKYNKSDKTCHNMSQYVIMLTLYPIVVMVNYHQ